MARLDAGQGGVDEAVRRRTRLLPGAQAVHVAALKMIDYRQTVCAKRVREKPRSPLHVMSPKTQGPSHGSLSLPDSCQTFGATMLENLILLLTARSPPPSRSQRNAGVLAQRTDLGLGLQVRLRLGVLVHVQRARRQVLLVPRVVLDVSDRQTLRGVGDEDPANEVLALAGHRPLRDLVVEVLQALADLVGVAPRVLAAALERVAPDHHHVQQHAAAPDVGRLAVVGVLRALAEDHLRRQIGTRSDQGRRNGVLDDVLGVSEVADLDQGPRLVVQQRVLELDVAVGDAHPVAVVEPDDQLLEEPPGQLLGDASVLADVVHEVASGCVLHDDGEVALRQEDALELDDVVVQQVLVVQNLALDVDVDARAPGQELDGDLLVVGLRVLGEEDEAECAAVQLADLHVSRVVGQRILVVGVDRHCSACV